MNNDNEEYMNTHEEREPDMPIADAQSPPDEGEGPIAQLKACEEKAQEYLNGWKRAQADFINYKNEEEKRLQAYTKFAIESLAYDLLSVVDSFELAQQSLKDDEEALKGIRIIRSQLLNALKNKGVIQIEIDVGKDIFDPKYHEAVGQEESERPSQTILEIVEPGFMLHEKVLRPAKVKIAQ